MGENLANCYCYTSAIIDKNSDKKKIGKTRKLEGITVGLN